MLANDRRGNLKLINSIKVTFLFFLLSPIAMASLNLNVKIGQVVGNKIIEVNKTIKAEYNKEIVISSDDLKNKIILSLTKIGNVSANGSKISPVQIDMKLMNKMQKIVGRPQTITSFYNRTAHFAVQSSGVAGDAKDLKVSLDFEEKN